MYCIASEQALLVVSVRIIGLFVYVRPCTITMGDEIGRDHDSSAVGEDELRRRLLLELEIRRLVKRLLELEKTFTSRAESGSACNASDRQNAAESGDGDKTPPLPPSWSASFPRMLPPFECAPQRALAVTVEPPLLPSWPAPIAPSFLPRTEMCSPQRALAVMVAPPAAAVSDGAAPPAVPAPAVLPHAVPPPVMPPSAVLPHVVPPPVMPPPAVPLHAMPSHVVPPPVMPAPAVLPPVVPPLVVPPPVMPPPAVPPHAMPSPMMPPPATPSGLVGIGQMGYVENSLNVPQVRYVGRNDPIPDFDPKTSMVTMDHRGFDKKSRRNSEYVQLGRKDSYI